MKSQINLATPRRVTKQAMRKLYLACLFSFLVSFAVAIFLLIFTFILNSQLSTLDGRKSDILHKISLISDKKEKELFIKDRLTNIQKIIKNRKDLSSKIAPILDAFPQNVGVDSLTAQDEVITIQVTAQSLGGLDSLINDKIVAFASSSKKTIRKVDIGNFGVRNGAYSASLDFYFIVASPVKKG